ncbi:MAG: trigger factor, partial [Clostridia bacterium]|nr:trigger factor [Clostridia bacterium]
MNVKNTAIENGTAKIQVELSAVEFDNALTTAYKKAKNKIAIPGFRKGKAPRKVVEAMYGAEIFYEDAVEVIFPEVYTCAVVDQKLKAVGRPSIADMEKTEEGGMLLTVATDLYPEAELGQYKGLEVEKTEIVVSDEEVEAEIAKMAEQNARISTVERAAQLGDTVTIDFEGFVDGKAFDGGKGENFDLKLGSGQFVPGFEDQLVGCTAGESKDVVVTFPENYTPELASKEAGFKCTVHEVQETVAPAMDDEFAKDLGFDTMDELRADTRTKAAASKEESAKTAFENACMDKAIANMTVTIPESMIEEQLDKEMDQFAYQVERSGMTMQDYAKMMGGDMSKLRAI